MAVTNRQTLKEYCLRQLGFPVVEVNVDDDQLDDRIDEALQTFQQFDEEGTLKMYLATQVTANTIADRYITLPNNVIGVTRILPISSALATGSTGNGGFNMFDLNYQLRLNELYDFTSADYVYFELAMQHIRTLEILILGENPIRFNKYDGKLYLDISWGQKAGVGDFIVAECYVIQDQDTTKFWNSIWLKQYTTALFKLQWGTNLKKFSGVKLPGGIELNGQKIFDEATAEKDKLYEELRSTYESPPMFIVG